ncbi:hypothetical protein BDZ97DRAFT_2001388 [Flammula alnicola]|nr:hypothetical protein BDZ97DRAFT_2001388 [Flammula alnicola]
MCRLGLGLKAPARARLWAAQALSNDEPGQKPEIRLGPARLWLKPGLGLQIIHISLFYGCLRHIVNVQDYLQPIFAPKMNVDGISNSAGLVHLTLVKVQYKSNFWLLKESPGLGRGLGLVKFSGRAKAGSRPTPLARLGPALLGSAWPGFWPQAGSFAIPRDFLLRQPGKATDLRSILNHVIK